MAANTKKLQFAEGTNVGAPTDLSVTSAGLFSYADDAAFVTAQGSATEGDAYLNTTTERIRYYSNGAWRDSLPASDAADVTKKVDFDLTGSTTGTTTTFDINNTASRTYTMQDETGTIPVLPIILTSEVSGALPIANGGTGQTSAAAAFDALAPTTTTGDTIYYNGTDNVRLPIGSSGQVLGVSSGAPAWIDAPSGSGGINYIDNNDFESSVTGWTTYADAAGATPVDGTGGTPNVTFTRNTTAPLSGNADGKFSKDAANRQGQGVAAAAVVPRAYQYGQKSQISFAWDGTHANYVAGDMVVYVYDVTNSVLITPTVTALPKAKTVVSVAWDQSSTGASYRLIFHVATTNASAYDVYMDDVQFGPGSPNQGAVVEEWKSLTLTSNQTGGTHTITAFGRRVGDTLQLKFRAVQSTSAGTQAAAYTITMPSGYTINTSLLPGGTNALAGFHTFETATFGNVARAFANSGTEIVFRESGAATNIVGTDFQNGYELHSELFLPITQFAGSTFAGQNNVEYASNSSTSVTEDLVSFAYGPDGSSIPSGSAASGFKKRVRFQTPIQASDMLTIEYQLAGGSWIPLPDGNSGFDLIHYQNGVSYGVGFFGQAAPAATDVDVYFGRYVYASGATYGAAGLNWSGLGSAKYRVKKVSGGQATGFGFSDGSSAGLLPPVTSMSDALATQLGYKQYFHGTTYNGGIAPTVTYSSGGGSLTSVQRALFIPYQTQSGQWRLKFNIVATFSSTTRTDLTIAVNGVTFKNTTNDYQAISGAVVGVAGAYISASYVVPNASTMVIGHASVSSSQYAYSGDVELESKPTWAY